MTVGPPAGRSGVRARRPLPCRRGPTTAQLLQQAGGRPDGRRKNRGLFARATPGPGLRLPHVVSPRSPSSVAALVRLSCWGSGTKRGPSGHTPGACGPSLLLPPQGSGGSASSSRSLPRPEVCGAEPVWPLPRFPGRGGGGGDTALRVFLLRLLRLSRAASFFRQSGARPASRPPSQPASHLPGRGRNRVPSVLLPEHPLGRLAREGTSWRRRPPSCSGRSGWRGQWCPTGRCPRSEGSRLSWTSAPTQGTLPRSA